tara:strand:- start:208 stop:600 length:393 start_codon:yes stop_codon:yes gene_type:complete
MKVPNNLYVKWTDEKGYGVFTDKPIKKGELIERCYCIKTGSPKDHVNGTLMDYVFNYPRGVSMEKGAEHVLPLGFGCIYNHDNNDNAAWYNTENIPFHFDFIALRDIQPGEEICTNYGDDYWPTKSHKPI